MTTHDIDSFSIVYSSGFLVEIVRGRFQLAVHDAALSGRLSHSNFAWAPLLAPHTQNIIDNLAGPESISLDEIDAAFALLEHKKEAMK
ncbi:hypothetical protein BDR03DRAFT_1012430 [Suillus americanus]|nr:hypothetical protein BDR03DRAFT_1012430 [Suillus americanus]